MVQFRGCKIIYRNKEISIQYRIQSIKRIGFNCNVVDLLKLLPIKTVLAFPQMFTFDEYLDYFIKNGGIIEAYPNA